MRWLKTTKEKIKTNVTKWALSGLASLAQWLRIQPRGPQWKHVPTLQAGSSVGACSRWLINVSLSLMFYLSIPPPFSSPKVNKNRKRDLSKFKCSFLKVHQSEEVRNELWVWICTLIQHFEHIYEQWRKRRFNKDNNTPDNFVSLFILVLYIFFQIVLTKYTKK